MPSGRVIRAINGVDRSRLQSVKSYDHCSDSSTVGLLAAILDAIFDLTAFRYSDFGRFLVCYSPPQTIPETVKKPLLAIFRGSTIFLLDCIGQKICRPVTLKPLNLIDFS